MFLQIPVLFGQFAIKRLASNAVTIDTDLQSFVLIIIFRENISVEKSHSIAMWQKELVRQM